MISGGYGDDVVKRVAGWVVDAVSVAVAGGAEMERGIGAAHRFEQGIRGGTTAPTVVGEDDVVALFFFEFGDVVKAFDGVGGGAAAAGAEEFTAQHANIPVDADHALAIVADAADGAGDVGAVAVVVHNFAGVVDGVGAVEVIDIAVGVFVLTVGLAFAKAFGALLGVDPHVGGQVFMVVVDAGVDNGDDHIFGTGGDVPSGAGVHISAVGAAGLAAVAQAPKFVKIGVVGRAGNMHQIVWLDIAHPRVALEQFHQRIGDIHLDGGKALAFFRHRGVDG